MKKKNAVALSILIFLLFAGVGSYMFFGRSNLKKLLVRRGDIVEGVYGIGTVVANRSYQLRSGVSSTITRIHIQEGDHVEDGDPLLEFNGKVYRAPFSGTISYFPYKTGENVFPQVIILSLIDFTNRYLVVDLEQEAALRVRPGQMATLSFDSLRQKNFMGKIESVYSQGQNFLGRIGIGHLPNSILPGMTADVAISISIHKGVLLVPIKALDGGQVHVAKGAFKKSNQVKVKVGVSDNEFAEILEGDLQEGDALEIITEPKD